MFKLVSYCGTTRTQYYTTRMTARHHRLWRIDKEKNFLLKKVLSERIATWGTACTFYSARAVCVIRVTTPNRRGLWTVREIRYHIERKSRCADTYYRRNVFENGGKKKDQKTKTTTTTTTRRTDLIYAVRGRFFIFFFFNTPMPCARKRVESSY